MNKVEALQKGVYASLNDFKNNKPTITDYVVDEEEGALSLYLKDEQGKPYTCTADDAAYATFELENGIIAHFNSSWAVRVRRDDLLTLQVDGTRGSAVAGLRECYIQHYGNTPKPVWNPDIQQPINFFEGWSKIPEQESYDNAFKVQWELFLRHVVKNEPFPWDLRDGARGVQLAEKGLESWSKRCWVDVPEL